MPDLHIHAGTVTVNMADDEAYLNVSAIDIRPEGESLRIWFVLADGQRMPLKLQDHKLLDGIRIPLPEGVLRVRAEEAPTEEPHG